MNMEATLTRSARDWWGGGAYVGSDWRLRLEFNYKQALALNKSEAWWAQGRLMYQFADLERELCRPRRWLPAMVTFT